MAVVRRRFVGTGLSLENCRRRMHGRKPLVHRRPIRRGFLGASKLDSTVRRTRMKNMSRDSYRFAFAGSGYQNKAYAHY